jgi:AAA domain-containing protein
MTDFYTPPLVRGQLEPAQYRDPRVPVYRENPLIEALPPIFSTAEIYQRLAYDPPYQEDQRGLPGEIRLHLIYNANQFFKPNWIHLELEQRLSRLLRAGYLARNPLVGGYWADVERRMQSLAELPHLQTAATGFNLVGISGIGKSTALEAILRLYPQVIIHQQYRQQPFSFVQIVWLKLDCPFDGSIKGLCVNFFQAVDEILGTHYCANYARAGRASTDELLGHMKRVTALHGVGCLVIDEIQHLSAAKSAGIGRMLNFFVQVVNTMGMPVVLVGTYKALPLLTSEFRLARRASGQGDFIWERMLPDEVWQMFIETLWRYQYVRQPTPLTAALAEALYEVSQGITDFAVKAYLLAQMRAIATGLEVVTPALLHSVARDSFCFAREVLEALRTRDWQKLKLVPDIQLVDLETHYQRNLQEMDAPGNVRPPSPSSPSAPPPAPPTPSTKPTGSRSAPSVSKVPKAKSPVTTWPEADLRRWSTPEGRQGLSLYQALQTTACLKPAAEFFEPGRPT